MATPTLAEAITASFYAWELRGRGWLRADYPVSLEPPHRPLLLVPGSGYGSTPLDDGKRPTFFSVLIDRAKGLFARAAKPEESDEQFEEEPLYAAAPRAPLVALSIRAPVNFKANNEIALRLITALSITSRPVSFELIGHNGMVALQIVCAEDDARHVVESITGFAPVVGVVPIDDQLVTAFEDGAESLIVDFGLRHEFFLPLRIVEPSHADPYIPLLGALAQAGRDEMVCVQILFEHVRNSWGRTILHAVTDADGSSRIADAPEFVALAREKVGSPLLAVVTRLAISGGSPARRAELSRATSAFFIQFTRQDGNSLIPLENDDYDEALHRESFLTRESYRSGMLLSAAELVGLVHLPDASLAHSALLREHGHTRPLPSVARGHELVLGANEHQGVSQPVTIAKEARLEHMHVIGATGTGKSTLLLNLIMQDIAHGHGLAVLEPHGDLIDDILARIPEERTNDVIVFDPSDEAWPVGFNILSAGSEIEKNLLASDLVGIFERLSTSWGDTMTTVLGNAVLAMIERPDGGTLVDLKRFLVEDGFRKVFVADIPDQSIRQFWEKEYPIIGSRSVGPLLARLDTFLRSRLVRNVVSQKNARLDLASGMESGKILLAKLSQGLIGEENSSLLGSLLVSKFHQLALARQRKSIGARPPFYLYLDEFQHFVTPSLGSLLSEGRKYGVGLVLAHQSLAQMDVSARIENAVLSAHIRIAFRVSDSDARKLADGFGSFETKDLQRLDRGEALIRLGSATSDCNLRTYPAQIVDEETASRRREHVIARSREQFATPIAELQISTAIEVPAEEVSAPAASRRALREPEEAKPPKEQRDPLPQVERADTPQPVLKRVKQVEDERAVAELGRGGREHKYIQHLIKRLAEERGFRAIIEEPIADGRSIDVVLRTATLAIACEVSVTTNVDHEVENIRKCVEGGFTRIFFICPDKRRREKVLEGAKGFAGNALAVLAPEELLVALDELHALAAPEETQVRGYKVKVNRQPISYEDLAQRRSALAEVIARSLTRQEGPGRT